VEFKGGEPRFFTFMMTDANGFVSFFHALTFYEEINDAEVECETFDLGYTLMRKQHEKEAKRRQQSLKAASEK
jgi:hypothetical protein